MTDIFGFTLEPACRPLGEVGLSPLVAGLVAAVTREPADTPYLSAVDLTRQGVETLLMCQPILAIEQRGMYECLCGIRTLKAARTQFAPTDLIPINIIQKPIPPDELLINLAGADLYLKSFWNMYLREPQVLAAAHDAISKQIIKMTAPGHQSKNQFAKDAGYSRQVFYQQQKDDS